MGYERYKKASINTASREQILLMLYEAAIKNCKLAKIAIDKKDIPAKCKHVTKSHDIVIELINSLDRSQAPELVEQLNSLYQFCSSKLLKANLENSTEDLDHAINVLTTLYEGWVAAVDQLKKNGGLKS